MLVDTAGHIVRVNRQAEALFGYSREELTGQSVERLLPDHLRSRHRQHRSMYHQDPRLRPMGAGLDLWGKRRDGSLVPLDIMLSPVWQGQTMLVMSVMRDITARRQVETALEQQRRELERSNAELEQFAYVASHDLKAPLRAITQLASWISEDNAASLPDSSQVHLAKLRARIERMERLLDDLLAYARAGRQHQPPEPVDIGQLVRQVADLLSPAPGFTVVADGSLPLLRTERVPLETVMRNLLGNALKHHHQPSQGQVVVTAQTQGEWVEFSVRDNGPGIPEQFHQRIFEIFQTLRPRDEVEGSGMGLAVVKKIVESRGGRISVESSPGQGATFRFTWPIEAVSP